MSTPARPRLLAPALVTLACACASAPEGPYAPARLDHLVYAAPDLESGQDALEALLGVRPALGGRHPGYGTHNALLSLGPGTYLEVIAPDPQAERPERGLLFGLDDLRAPRLATWVLRTETIASDTAAAERAGLEMGRILSGSRARPDGTEVAWQVTDPYAMQLEGAVPFLISWGNTPHPSGGAPAAGELLALHIEHPEPERVRSALEALDVKVDVRLGAAYALVATVRTADGREVELR